MSPPVCSQIDAGVALALGAIVATAGIRKLQRPLVFALTLQRLDPGWAGRRTLTTRLTFFVAGYEILVGIGVVAFRGATGFAFACALLVACVGFLLALVRAVQLSIPCGCFGRLGKTAAGGREIARAVVLVAGAAFLVVYRAVAVNASHGFGPVALVAVIATALVIVVAQRIGARVRPGVELVEDGDGRDSLVRALRDVIGYDNDLYSSGK